MHKRTLEERFWEKVAKRGPNECWLWTAYISTTGYGGIHGRRVNGESRMVSAHRLAWEITNGPIEDGLHCLHRCDVRACCNPAHLFLGTNEDNVADRDLKGRVSKTHQWKTRGESNGNSKLTEADIIRIRSLHGTMTLEEIGAPYGIGRGMVWAIIHRRIWRHI
jgi:hypothetical protein